MGALIIGLVVMLPFAAYERPDTREISVGTSDLVSLVILGAVVTAGTYFFWSYSIRHLQANEASVLCSIEPAFGLVFAWLLLQEGISVAGGDGGGGDRGELCAGGAGRAGFGGRAGGESRRRRRVFR